MLPLPEDLDHCCHALKGLPFSPFQINLNLSSLIAQTRKPMKIADNLVQLQSNDVWDKDILMKESLPVNIRFLRSNKNYKKIIMSIICYMEDHLRSSFEDYPSPKGVCAMALGFPLQIIGYKINCSSKLESQFMINPKITWANNCLEIVKTNDGTVNLKNPVDVKRHRIIDVSYYDLQGIIQRKSGLTKTDGGYIIQHEIEQMNGKPLILST